MFKKALSAIAIATLALSSQAADVLKVGATAVPHAEILNHIKPALKAQGIDLEIKEFSDYVQPNAAVEDKQLDANFFQHQPYLDSYNKDRKSSLVAVPNGKVHVEPFGAYSSKIKNIKDLKDGATVAIPNDPSNGGRALLLLQKHGLIELKDAKTKALAGQLGKLELGNRALFIDGDAVHESFAMASANLIGVDSMPAMGANVYDILRADTLVLTRAGLEKLEARFNG